MTFKRSAVGRRRSDRRAYPVTQSPSCAVTQWATQPIAFGTDTSRREAPPFRDLSTSHAFIHRHEVVAGRTDLRVSRAWHCALMKRGAWATEREILDGASVNGVITRQALRQCGVSDGSITARTADDGKWRRILPGIVLLQNGRPSALQQQTAALLYGGEQSVLTGGAAVHRHGFDRVGSDVHILVPSTLRRTSTSFVRVERTTRMPEAQTRGQLRVAPLPRALADAARSMHTTSKCIHLFAQAIQRGSVDLDELVREFAEGPRQYGAVARLALRDLADDAHSVAEAQAQKLYATTDLPKMVHNVPVYDPDGELICIPDGWIDVVGLGWQIDSLAHHLSPADHAATMAKRAAMEKAGAIMISHLPSQIRDDPTGVIADLTAGYERALARPRPNLHLGSA